MADLLKITVRAGEALKPFMDEALRLETNGLLQDRSVVSTSAFFSPAEWRELLAAWRESQRVAEGIHLEHG